MIKKIKIEHLKPGVFVHDFNCDWAGENVFISKALIKSQETIDIINSWGIKEVYIDTDLGLDVESAREAAAVQRETNADLHNLAAKEDPAPSPAISFREEVQIARKISNEAFDTIQEAMQSVQEGEPVDVENTFHLVEKMKESINRNKDALILLTRIRKKDEYTLAHSVSVSALLLSFCNFCGMPHEMTMNMATGALLHDIGKTRIPDAILNKPGKLSSSEFEVMKKHAEYSAEILEEAADLPLESYDIALHHHERYDGTGYPHGLQGRAIELGSRMSSICDVYDAITSVRCYRNGLDRVEGLRKLYEWSGYHFDKKLTYKFIQSIGVYPIGTCVRLEDELTAVVVGSTENVLQPVVRVFYDDNKDKSMAVREMDLSVYGINVAGYDPPETWSSGKQETYQKNRNALNPFH